MSDDVTYDRLLEAMRAEKTRWDNLPSAFGIPDEDYVFYKTLTPWVPAFLALAWLTGGRVSEVLAVRGRDIEVVDVGGKTIAIITLMNLKQRRNAVKESIVVIDNYPEAWEVVEKYHDCLANPDGLLFHRSRKSAWWNCKRIFDLGTHKVGRHSWVMNQARRGAQLLDIKQMGGWSRLQSMDAYVHSFGRKELVKRALELK